MANNSGNVGFVVIVIVIALIGGGVYGIRSCSRNMQTKPFAEHLTEYTHFPKLNESGSSTTISGKAITIDKTTNEIDETYFDLPAELKASKPEEVGTVVWISCSESVAGTYQSGAKGYLWNCDVTVIDLATASTVGKKSFSGDHPPQTKSNTSDWHGSKPNSEIISYIKSLKR